MVYAIAISQLIANPVYAGGNDTLRDLAVFAAFQYEASVMTRTFDGSHKFCISVDQQDPSPSLLVQLQSIYELLEPESTCQWEAAVAFEVIGEFSTDSLALRLDCLDYCMYATTYTLELSSGNWLITQARHTMR